MSVSFSAEMSVMSKYRVRCECGNYSAMNGSSYESARFAADLFNANSVKYGKKLVAECMEGCARCYVEDMSEEVNMSNAHASMMLAMMGVADGDDRFSGSMNAVEFMNKAQAVGAFGDEGSYASVKAAALVKVAADAMSKGVKVCWG